MDMTNAPSHTRDVVGAATELKRPTGVSDRHKMIVAATVLVVLSLAAWAMTGFYGDRPSALPRTGNPMPALPTARVDTGLQEELVLITTALTRRDADDEMLIEAVYSTPKLFAALSRHEAALQGDRESEQLFQTYQRDHELDRYLVFTLILDQDGPGLSDYRPEEMIRLRTGDGREVRAVTWVEVPDLMSDSSRVGMLHFPRVTADDRLLLSEHEGWFELVLSGLGEDDQILRWELPIAYPAALAM